jgi:ketosteroid isomerase-like protein
VSAFIDIVKRLQSAAERRDRAAILALVTSDLEYHYHVGSKPVRGPEGLGRFLDKYWERSKDGVWNIETFAQSGDDKLLMEGLEEYTDITNDKRVVNRYMGVMEFRDGKIARWRDYFQLDRPPASS